MPFSTVLLYTADRTCTLGDVWRHSARCYWTLLTGPVPGCGDVWRHSARCYCTLLTGPDLGCGDGEWRHSARCYCTLLTGPVPGCGDGEWHHSAWCYCTLLTGPEPRCGAIQHGVTVHCRQDLSLAVAPFSTVILYTADRT